MCFPIGHDDGDGPGTTVVPIGTCGDYDGDGRIGTAEDTDGADRIFGTIGAALGPGTGAAAGTGINQNGTITIVRSGHFPEILTITADGGVVSGQGNVTLQAAPGVSADINAVFQGDPAGQNNVRQAAVGITIQAIDKSRVVLRNLTIRNWQVGIRIVGDSRVTIDNCRIENNVDYGIQVIQAAQVSVTKSRILSTGYRVGTLGTCPTNPGCVPAPGDGISIQDSATGTVTHTQITGSFNAAISNTSGGGPNALYYYEVFLSHNTFGVSPISIRDDF